MVSIKIDKVEKTTPLHPNMLLGKIIEIEDTGCVKIVTELSNVNTLISLMSNWIIQLKYLSQLLVRKRVDSSKSICIIVNSKHRMREIINQTSRVLLKASLSPGSPQLVAHFTAFTRQVFFGRLKQIEVE